MSYSSKANVPSLNKEEKNYCNMKWISVSIEDTERRRCSDRYVVVHTIDRTDIIVTCLSLGLQIWQMKVLVGGHLPPLSSNLSVLILELSLPIDF